MHQFEMPATVALSAGDHLASLVTRRSGPDADVQLFRRHTGGRWVTVTAGQWRTEVEGVAQGLLAREDGRLRLTPAGLPLANRVMAELV